MNAELPLHRLRFQMIFWSGGESMLTWKSPISIGFDIVFGILPAAYLALVSSMLLFNSELRHVFSDLSGTLTISGIGLIGLTTTLSLIYVTFARENTVNRVIFKTILGLGVFLAVFVPAFLWILNLTNQTTFAYSLVGFIIAVEIPIVIVAIKYIYLLSRA
jgi:hypothetical protein